MALDTWTEVTAESIFGKSQLYQYIKLLLASKENTSNKVSSWSSTTNNTRYPTEKLVKDSISLSSYTLTSSDIASSNFNSCSVQFYKQLNMVTCIYHINTVLYNNTSDHTVTSTGVPSAYRPSSIFYQDVCTYGGQKLDGLLTVGTDGSMKIRMGTANTSMNIYGSFTYIV